MALGQQSPEAAELEKSVRQLREQFEERQQAYERQLDALTRQLEALQAQAESAPASTNAAAALSSEPPPTPPVDGEPPLSARPWSPADPIRLLGRGNSYMNISFDALFAAGASTADDIEGGTQVGAHDPNQRGFTVQNLELTLDGAIDPYFRGLSSLIFQIDSEGESFLEVEEAYLETISLPANLQLRAGQYFTEFGRLNPTHPHAWTFVDQPIINGRLLGPDGLRNPGARLSWLTPTPFYSELFFGIQNSQGETAHSFRSDHEEELVFGRAHDPGSVSSLGDMLFSTRYAASFELSDTQTLLAGASGAFGPNGSGADTDTQVFGVDLFWKWRPVNHQGGFPFVSWQTEAMARRYEAGAFAEDADGDGFNETDLPEETLWDYGFYSQIQGARVAAFHNTWPYFAHQFGLRCDLFLEPKPGIPPTASHLASAVTAMKSDDVPIVLVEPYQNRRTAEKVAREAGAVVVDVTQYPGGVKGTEAGYVEMLDYVVNAVARGLETAH